LINYQFKNWNLKELKNYFFRFYLSIQTIDEVLKNK